MRCEAGPASSTSQTQELDTGPDLNVTESQQGDQLCFRKYKTKYWYQAISRPWSDHGFEQREVKRRRLSVNAKRIDTWGRLE